MNKFLTVFGLATLLVACKGENEFTINGSIKGLDGKQVFLEVMNDSTGPKVLDTAKIENGRFTFNGEALEPKLYSVRIETLMGKPFFVGEAGNIDIAINKDSISAAKVTGTPNNDKMAEFNKLTAPIQKEAMAFQQANRDLFMKAQQTGDTAALAPLKEKFAALRKQMDETAIKFIKANSNAYISMLLIKNRMYSYDANIKEIEELYKGLDTSIRNSAEGKALGKRISDAHKINIGQAAPDFIAPGPDGKEIVLRRSLGKVTILDFWASWCGPCRKANPEVVALYNEFHDKGLNIVGVSLDKDAAAWKKAIADDGLTWTHVSNLKQWEDPIAKAYFVEAIPQMFVLNQNGVVIAKDIHGKELRDKIAQVLNPAPVAATPVTPAAPAAKK